jgi:drug/metabolite transporter (DMT)-like permease
MLALASAVVYGVSDYVGGRLSRRIAPIAITFVAESTMLLVFAIAVPVLETGSPSPAAVGWGIVAGISGSLGVLGLYAALSRGSMTVVAPITGIVAAGVPVIVGVALGERPDGRAVVGILLAVVAVGLIGGVVGVSRDSVDASTVGLAVLVGGAFGLLFVAYSRTGDDSGLWPLLTARAGGTPLLGIAFLLARRRRAVDRLTRAIAWPGVVIGLLVGLANGLYLFSAREGLLSIVAVVVSLYPASTIVLASVLDKERVGPSQAVGMGLAVAAVALITLGS